MVVKVAKSGKSFTTRMETQQQTNSDAITVDDQKPVLDNCIDKDWITCYANDANSTGNSQPWKPKPALGSWPRSILTFQDLHLTSAATWWTA